MAHQLTSESLAYHAARLLLLIRLCGKPRGNQLTKLPGIEGRTLLAKLDFFLRYPQYLRRAAKILGVDISRKNLEFAECEEEHAVESRMVRYLYGPWDHVYYPTLAYLVGKELIVIDRSTNTEVFRLTEIGQDITDQLIKESVYKDLAQRADVAYHLFSKYKGTGLKDFIYVHFPEVVNRELGEAI